MDLAFQRLICHKNQPTNHLTASKNTAKLEKKTLLSALKNPKIKKYSKTNKPSYRVKMDRRIK